MPAPDFTTAQLDAIDWRDLDACVVAGPGSGKTTVLVERYRRLVEIHHFDPRHILAITFTEKAAANMKAKLAEEFRHDPVRLREIESGWVSTIHGFCARLLRENAIAAGIDPRFTVLDARESDLLQLDCLNTALDELVFDNRARALEIIGVLQNAWGIAGELKSAYDAIRSAGKSIAEVRAMPNPGAGITVARAAELLRANLATWPPRTALTLLQREHFDELLEWTRNFTAKCPLNRQRVPRAVTEELREFKDSILPAVAATTADAETAPYREAVFNILARFDELYTRRKNERGALDFNDLERHAIALLRAHNITGQFRQIMLDEFQDINEQQAELIRLIRGENVFFAVGDVNQSIYGFRHARPEIFHEYRREIETAGKQSVELLHNFRSRPEILRCVESLLNTAEGIEPHELVAARGFPEKTNPSVEVLRILEDEDVEDDDKGSREARWIAHRILELSHQKELSHHKFSDFAVLCRSREGMRPILAEFDRAGIPYVCGRRQSFLLSREGLDITALLKVLANPRDGIALATVLRSALAGVSDGALLRLRQLASSLTSGLNTGKFESFPEDDARKLSRFSTGLRRWRSDLGIVPLDVLIGRILNDCGVELNENFEAFLRLARSRGPERTLTGFLEELESIESAFNTESELSDTDQGNCVQVMTAHAAKGLEFPVTIIAAMDRGTRRDSAAITFTPEHGLGISWKRPLIKDGQPDSWALANKERLKAREQNEANRLLYVAMTRAEDHLILSYSKGKNRPGFWAKLLENLPTTEHADDPPPLAARTAELQNEANFVMVPRPEITGQEDTTVNVTSLTVFANCPRKYYIQRYIGWGSTTRPPDPEEAPEDVSPAEMGSFVHDLLAGKPGPHPLEAHELAEVFHRGPLGVRAARSVSSAREWDFIADIDDTLVRGTIDLWFEENGEYHVVDYKTDAVPRPAEYAPQLALYALAMERAFGKRPASAHLHFLRPDVIAEVPLDTGKARDLLEDLRHAQSTLTFPLNEGDHCRTCPFYRSLCPAGLS